MQFLGLRHHGEAPKSLSPEEQMHQDRLLTRVGSGLDADRAALTNYPGLVGKLGTFEIDPAIAAQLDATQVAQNDSGEMATPAPGTAEIAGRFASVPTTTVEMPANQPEPNMIQEQMPLAGAQEAYYESIS